MRLLCKDDHLRSLQLFTFTLESASKCSIVGTI